MVFNLVEAAAKAVYTGNTGGPTFRERVANERRVAKAAVGAVATASAKAGEEEEAAAKAVSREVAQRTNELKASLYLSPGLSTRTQEVLRGVFANSQLVVAGLIPDIKQTHPTVWGSQILDCEMPRWIFYCMVQDRCAWYNTVGCKFDASKCRRKHVCLVCGGDHAFDQMDAFGLEYEYICPVMEELHRAKYDVKEQHVDLLDLLQSQIEVEVEAADASASASASASAANTNHVSRRCTDECTYYLDSFSDARVKARIMEAQVTNDRQVMRSRFERQTMKCWTCHMPPNWNLYNGTVGANTE